MSRFLLTAFYFVVMTNLRSETIPHDLPTRPSHTTSVWDLALGEVKSTLKGHTEYVRSVAISPDGKTIVSGSDDKTVR